jgi:hypothetical protein
VAEKHRQNVALGKKQTLLLLHEPSLLQCRAHKFWLFIIIEKASAVWFLTKLAAHAKVHEQ